MLLECARAADESGLDTVRFGEGWIPAGVEPADLKPGIEQLHEMGAKAGRPPLEVIAMKTLKVVVNHSGAY